ncbi:MAG: VWA domain-containing protein [Planctomycetales bacterium]|nr:VWA domain-containing protein [Planctomycetales bacterium]
MNSPRTINAPPIPRAAAFVIGMIGVLALGSTAHAAGQLVADGGLGGKLETQSHDVRVIVNNGVAVTEVEQVFVNTENRVVEALYTFPVPKRASVSNFSMWINGKEIVGEVVEKERAREIYNSYKQQRRDPGLLEQVDYKRFEMRIFPIPALGEQRVKVTYYQELDVDHDWASFVYPLATLADGRAADPRVSGRFSFALDVKSETPIVAMESNSHPDDIVVATHNENYRQASLELDEGDLSRDVAVSFHLERPVSGLDLIASKKTADDGYFMLTLTAGKELEQQEVGMDYVFVLDVSGSMASHGKLAASEKSIGSFIDALSPADRCNVIAFNVQPTPLFAELRDADAETLTAANAFLQTQRARGGTALRPALETAYRYRDTDRQLNVVILSDGMTGQQEQTELLSLIRSRPDGCRVFCIGVGNEVNRPLLQQMANDAGGLAAFLSQEENFDRQAEAFRRKLVRPAMANLKLDFDGVHVYDVQPETLPDLYHGAPLRIYGRYSGAGPVDVALSADVLGQVVQKTFQAELPEMDADNPEIERAWAQRRVESLFDKERRDGTPGSRRDAIVQLCEDYSIPSEYASFLVLENDAEYQRWSIERRNATRTTRDRDAREARREELRRLRDQSLAKLAPAPSQREFDKFDSSNAVGPPAVESVAAPQQPQSSRRNFNLFAPDAPRNNASGQPAPSSRPSRSFGGGGAVDPLSGGLLLSFLAGSAWRRQRRNAEQGNRV